MEDDTSAFEALITGLDYPLYIVTAGSGDDVDGCLVGFATQCSINPPRFIACLSNKNLTTRLAARADALVVHVLHEADRDLAVRFGARTGDETAKLAGCAWSPGPGGAPILDGVDWFAGQIVARHNVGDHVAHVLDVFDRSSGRATSRQLGYQAVRGMAPGHKA